MSETTFAVAFVERSGLDIDTDRNLLRGNPTPSHGIAHAVGKRPEQPVRVWWDIASLVQPGDRPLGRNGGGGRRALGGRFGRMARTPRWGDETKAGDKSKSDAQNAQGL